MRLQIIARPLLILAGQILQSRDGELTGPPQN
jgi:hypothetical protein